MRTHYDVLAFMEDGDELFLERVWSHSPEAAIAEVTHYRAGDLPEKRLGLVARVADGLTPEQEEEDRARDARKKAEADDRARREDVEVLP